MFQFHDIAGYNSKDVEVYVFNPYSSASTPTSAATDEKAILRGAQSFEPSEEMSEDVVEELGFEATKTIYGAAEYGVSVELLVRDLLQIARLSGRSAQSANRIVVTEFKKVNLMAYYRDPNTESINLTKYAGGFKSNTASSPVATGGNATITLDGSADLCLTFEGSGEVVQHVGDGTTTDFDAPTSVDSLDNIIVVEAPSGNILDADEIASVTAGTVSLVEAPEDGAVVRIVHDQIQ